MRPAEVEGFREQDDLGALVGGLADAGDGAGEVGVARAALDAHLDKCQVE